MLSGVPIPREAREQSVETLRGLAVILMVSAHVIGGMDVAEGSAWRHAYLSLEYLRMPLFTVISGYVYALRPIRAGGAGQFARGKVRRLAVPYLFVSTVFILVQSMVPGVHDRLEYTALPRILIEPYAHFWYLYALFWVFLIVGALDLAGALATPRRWAASLLCAVALSEWCPLATHLFAIAEAYYLFPYFILGIGIHRHGRLLASPRTLWALALVLVAAILIQQASLFHLWEPSGLDKWMLNTTLGMLAAAVAFRVRFSWRPLARIGSYSYGIYLLHVFGTAGARIGLYRAGIVAKGPVFVIALAAGIFLPMLAEHVIDEIPTLRLLVLGKSTPLGIVSSPETTPTA